MKHGVNPSAGIYPAHTLGVVSAEIFNKKTFSIEKVSNKLGLI
jgi:hypothetical protein